VPLPLLSKFKYFIVVTITISVPSIYEEILKGKKEKKRKEGTKKTATVVEC
jgi:hypothetical protein